MAENEKKATAKAEINEMAVAADMVNGNLVVVREAIKGKDGKQMRTQDGRNYFAYVIRGKVRGRDIKVDFTPKDIGGYEPLDIIFDISPKAELFMEERESESEKTGKVTKYMAYWVRVVDEDGEVWECNIKPQRDSDKTLLRYLLTEARKAEARNASRANPKASL